jgi:hypothetical protein
MFDRDLFQLRAGLSFRFEMIAEGLPVLLVDNLYQRADDIREAALSLDYRPVPYDYPGSIAEVPRDNPSLNWSLGQIQALVNSVYLPRVPISADGKRIANFSRMHTDFARVDIHPNDLNPDQRRPHIDPIPIFGLVYLNREERGGTLFFRKIGESDTPAEGSGYQTESGDGFELCGRIEPAFNRLAIYPGFVPHSGEIKDWIETEERFTNPRLTQRLMFF